MATDREQTQGEYPNSGDLMVLREMHKVLFGCLAITSQHLQAFDVLLRAAGYDPAHVYREEPRTFAERCEP